MTLAKTSAPLRFVWSWPDIDPAALDPSTVTVSRDPDGRWFVVLHADVADPAPLPATGRTVGVDLGLKDFAVLSTGEHIPHPQHMERHEQRLKRYQRRLARCQQGSANRQKARVKVARQHARVADARRDFLHKASTDLVRRFDGIAVEDLAVRNMVRNRSLAKAISRTGWAQFRAFLAYKAERYGRELAVVDRWYPSSKTCSACGHLLAIAFPWHPFVGVPGVRRPASAGHQRREEHRFGRRAGGCCLRRRCKTGGGNPGAVASETGTPAGDRWNPRPLGRGGCQWHV